MTWCLMPDAWCLLVACAGTACECRWAWGAVALAGAVSAALLLTRWARGEGKKSGEWRA